MSLSPPPQRSPSSSPHDATVNPDADTDTAKSRRILPRHHVYSATSPCFSGSSNVTSKKITASKCGDQESPRGIITRTYARAGKRPEGSFFDTVLSRKRLFSESEGVGGKEVRKVKKVKSEVEKLGVDGNVLTGSRLRDCRNSGSKCVAESSKVRSKGKSEVEKLGVDCNVLTGSRLRECRNSGSKSNVESSKVRTKGKSKSSEKRGLKSANEKKWVRLIVDDVEPEKLVGLQCKVYWPLDADWYSGCVMAYNSETKRHNVNYDDGDKEDLLLSNEKVKFLVTNEEMEHLSSSSGIKTMDCADNDYNEMIVLAASLDDCEELEPGDIIWAKLTGYCMWPAIVIDESLASNRKGLIRVSGGKDVPVQFFGTHDFARIKVKFAYSFLKGLLSRFHKNSNKPAFIQSLEEAKTYLSEQKLPKTMMLLRNDSDVDNIGGESSGEGSKDSDEDCIKDSGSQTALEGLKASPYNVGDLQIISLGKIVKDSEFFQDGKFIWPEGYIALRRFNSLTDPTSSTLYKMEVLRDAELKFRPLFRVTMDSGEQFTGSTPSECWNKIYKRLRRLQKINFEGSKPKSSAESYYKSGTDMFGFSNPEVLKLIRGLSKSKFCSKKSTRKSISGKYPDTPVGFRPVRVDWKDLDKCNVCHMDEEYENNLFLQCDKCRMMVHAGCYGEVGPVDGVLWLCKLCRPGAPDPQPLCCLCPVLGGAMKPTTDGRWAHLACAMWVPETCLSDVKKMEPIDGLDRISKDRRKLLCSICNVSYGACIQCSNNNCCVAYHPLCARAAGLCVELENEDRVHLLTLDDDEENQCIRLLSFCKRHRKPSSNRLAADDCNGWPQRQCSNYQPPVNPSGCARTEPYSYSGRRGRQEPEALAAASLKRSYVENRPYIVGGYTQHELSSNRLPSSGINALKLSFDMKTLNAMHSEADKYIYMKNTFRKRLAFGKSGIHGFGVFAKHPHRAGDMVIEYIGELVRPSIADRRERLIYNSLVGAGTYMFRIDDKRVVDATRTGSIAHLINHSCEPNCYSRNITVNGDEHIIIYAKRDIKRWEELTYDYRFCSVEVQLPCSCGFPRCRGVVNDPEAQAMVAKKYVRCSELEEWKGE